MKAECQEIRFLETQPTQFYLMRDGQFRLMTESYLHAAIGSQTRQFYLMLEGRAERDTGQVDPHASGEITSQPS